MASSSSSSPIQRNKYRIALTYEQHAMLLQLVEKEKRSANLPISEDMKLSALYLILDNAIDKISKGMKRECTSYIPEDQRKRERPVTLESLGLLQDSIDQEKLDRMSPEAEAEFWRKQEEGI